MFDAFASPLFRIALVCGVCAFVYRALHADVTADRLFVLRALQSLGAL